jgi:uncharacterized SAM-binding protein YcdF (DUF218 family)
MRWLLDFVFSVTGLVCIPLLAAAWMRLRPASRAARRSLTGVVLMYVLASIYAVPYTPRRVLVAGFDRFSSADGKNAKAIVLLGGGTATIEADDRSRHIVVMHHAVAARVLEAARVYDLIGPVWIISSGGVSKSNVYREPSGVTMRDALVKLGIPESRIVLETASLSTRDQAMLIAPLLRSLGVTHSVLVTSDIHMRRSLGAFRMAGVSVVPAIASDPMVADSLGQWALPSERGFRLSDSLVHESLGLAYYAAKGWWRRGT